MDKALVNLDKLRIPADIRNDLQVFLKDIMDFYAEDLVSILAFGSCVSGDYTEATSDINLMVVYSDLNIADLNKVAEIARNWLRKRNFAPRFISHRNLLNSSGYFPVDMIAMKNAHVALYGEDLLAEIAINQETLRWQLGHDIKSMRTRIKQQYWRTSGTPQRMRAVLLERFSSLAHLVHALFLLEQKPTASSHTALMEQACREINLDKGFIDQMFKLKADPNTLKDEELAPAFVKMMDLIRAIDERVDKAVAQ